MNIDWQGLIGLSLTLVIGVSGAVYSNRPIGEKGGEVLVAICVAIVAGISTYLATKNEKK